MLESVYRTEFVFFFNVNCLHVNCHISRSIPPFSDGQGGVGEVFCMMLIGCVDVDTYISIGEQINIESRLYSGYLRTSYLNSS